MSSAGQAPAAPESTPSGERFIYHATMADSLARLAQLYPHTKLLALGQTVFWDEPLKATLRKALDDFGLGVEMLLGVHDTDYFSKLHHPGPTTNGYRMLPHNDGSTRDLWAAAAEMSQLFGSETVVTRDRYLSHGVAFDKLAGDFPGGREALIERQTEAWGWRGLAGVGGDTQVTAELPLRDVLPALSELVDWALEGTLNTFPCPQQRETAAKTAEEIRSLLRRHAELYPEWTLSDFYQHLLPHLYGVLLGRAPERVSVIGTVGLLTLNRKTADLPRFRLLEAFLNPETRRACENAYDASLEGSAMYALHQFGPGALPFDLVIPGRGRGTLRLTDKYAVIMTPRPIFVSLRSPITSIAGLAEWIEETFGDGVAVTGKAVTLVSMLSHEFMFVFHEEASAYVCRTRRMNDLLRASGVDVSQHPILRIRYSTWDALAGSPVWLRLPPHLAAAFGQDEIQGPSFAGRWRAVVEAQLRRLEELAGIHRPRDLIALLKAELGGSWTALAGRYDSLLRFAHELEEKLQDSTSRIRELFHEWRRGKAEYSALEREKGKDFRRRLRPLLERASAGEARLEEEIKAEVERRKAEFDVRLTLLRRRINESRAEIGRIRAERHETCRSAEALANREARREIEREAELARLRLVRNAILTADGLTATNHRPAAWWFPMLSPDGAWFRRVAETAEAYFEPLHS
jgi:hypothetical protein